MKYFSLYIVNEKNGTSRDVSFFASNTISARKIAEENILSKNEKIMSVFQREKV